MLFSNKDKAVIRNLYQFKEYALQRILTKFLKTKCKRKELSILLKRFEKSEALTKDIKLQTETHA